MSCTNNNGDTNEQAHIKSEQGKLFYLGILYTKFMYAVVHLLGGQSNVMLQIKQESFRIGNATVNTFGDCPRKMLPGYNEMKP
jgi:hypothetical protein